MDTMKDMRQWVRASRLLLGISQREYAENIGATRDTVAAWETRGVYPSRRFWPAIREQARKATKENTE